MALIRRLSKEEVHALLQAGRRQVLDGAEIVRRHRTGDGPPDFVGVAGGFPPKGKGTRLQELIVNQSWERRPFEVQYEGHAANT